MIAKISETPLNSTSMDYQFVLDYPAFSEMAVDPFTTLGNQNGVRSTLF
jgi:hypothetical protein